MSSETLASAEDDSRQESIRDEASVEAGAFLGWVKAVGVQTESLVDGNALMQVLGSVDAQHFRNPHADLGSKDTYVVKLGTLKRLYKLMAQFYSEPLRLNIDLLPVPDLDELARTSSNVELCKLCRLAIGITIVSEDTKAEHIAAIQTLPEADQGRLMVAIDAIMGATTPIPSGGPATDSVSADGEDEGSDTAALTRAKRTAEEMEQRYVALMGEHQQLTDSHEDVVGERDELQKEISRLQESAHREKTSGTDALLREEVDRLRSQLRKSEDHLAETEGEVERLSATEKDLNKKITELQAGADEAARLKDQVDEYRHLADKSQRLENALEKYKKKLEDTAGVRRQLKDLEDQNSELIDRNASLEREYSRVADFKPLMESYKSQIDDLNTTNSRLQEEATMQAYNLEQTTLQVKALEESRSKDLEELQLYQERVQELELGGARPHRKSGKASGNGADGEANGSNEEDSDDDDVLIGSDLDDALQGTTMTDLKLRIHALSRELKDSKRNRADGSRIVVLENLLEDAQRQRKKFEADYWNEYKERLRLAGQLEKVRSGQSELGDGDEAAYALRLRLNEVVAELDDLKKERETGKVAQETMERELTIAKSDLALVGRDQIEILGKLRASVEQEKVGLEAQVQQLKQDLGASREGSERLAGQIQGLLMDKISLMEGGWSAKEDDLRREKEMGALRASLAGKTLPPEAEEMLLRLTSENKDAKSQLGALQDRMKKAKAFIKQQDRLLKEAHSKTGQQSQGSAPSADTEQAQRELELLKREQELMMSAFHHLANTKLPSMYPAGAAPAPRSWLAAQQRERMSISWALGRR
ncbi:unnamed protein product [Parajaminaea phylloscopi]